MDYDVNLVAMDGTNSNVCFIIQVLVYFSLMGGKSSMPGQFHVSPFLFVISHLDPFV